MAEARRYSGRASCRTTSYLREVTIKADGTRKYPMPQYIPHIDICQDPENCTKDHNDGAYLAWAGKELHHCGCECSDCMQFYWSLKH